MSRIEFVKAHAWGNDFLIVEETFAQSRHAAMARRLCARNTGVGADGIVLPATFQCRWQRSRTQWQWNALRRRVAGRKRRPRNRFVRNARRCPWVQGGAPRRPRVVDRERDGCTPRDAPRDQDFRRRSPDRRCHGKCWKPTLSDREDFSSHGTSWQELGAKISVDSLFRFGTNVEFVRILAPAEIAFRIYERGCGPTTSSGTGTCASATAAIALHGAERTLTAVALGGAQQVVWPSDQTEMMLTGPSEIICIGEAEI
jgi:diaminopimelate epimerase